MSTKSVFIVGIDNNVNDMFKSRGYRRVGLYSDADLVCFTGGEDVSPLFYGQKIVGTTSPNLARDIAEIAVWKNLPITKPKVGICRGMQLGCVLSGGRLWQDVDNHSSSIHDVVLEHSGDVIPVTSVHHQMVRPADDAVILATSRVATYLMDGASQYKYQGGAVNENNLYPEVEAMYCAATNFLGVQWHPEYNHGPSEQLFFKLIDEVLQP